ncbi:hypothetical protein [Legionella rowbothamii]|uniref:hypothetical protein n=1 Tax=Legionella rowbothamii TaxID=96229 RepID=UPI001054E037|nr:hypothetical protein [Legionella rowbothamii]
MLEPKETSNKTTMKTKKQDDEVFLSMSAQLDAEENAKKKLACNPGFPFRAKSRSIPPKLS